MSVINTNVKSILAQNALVTNDRSLTKSMQQLSTGKRINSAADDAAGLAIASRMTAQIKGLNQGVRNANDGIAMLQTAEGATQEISNMLQRMRELSVQAANDTYGSTDRTAMSTEVGELSAEITRIGSNTQWNGMAVLASSATYTFQVGSGSTSTSSIDVSFSTTMSASNLGVSSASLNLTSNTFAQASIASIDTAISSVNTFRSTLGAKINRLTSAADNLANISMNTAASRSRIEDADYAQATTELARAQIIQQAGTAMLAQANQQPQSVLSLLK